MNVQAFIQGYNPTSITRHEWEAVRDFTITIITTVYTDDTPRGSVRNGAVAVAGISAFALNSGIELETRQVFDDRFIEHYVYTLGVSQRTKSARRAVLTRIGRAINDAWMGRPATPAYSTQKTADPYTAHEVTMIENWSATLRTSTYQYNATMLVALALGAGLRAREIDLLTVKDVEVDHQGVILHPHGYRGAAARDVPLAIEYEDDLIESIKSLQRDDFVFMPGRAGSGSKCVSDFTKRAKHPVGVEVTATRLRTTWIVELMRRNIPESAICDAAGLQDLQHYVKYRGIARPATALDFRSAIRGTTQTVSSFPPLRVVGSN